ncbi:MAG: 4'-phosphopantetheinyl transferase superfamily protein [Clostridiales bacterium]|nr:4'-phosphopantetheinyl transferase superfamily protein [Clostridiales bacterium]
MNTEALADPQIYARCYCEMSAMRQEKINRLHLENDRKLSLAAGILLDRGLQAYGLREGNVRIAFGEHGKPYLPDFSDIHFSLSHSHEMAMAVFAETEVGCDIEYQKQLNEKLARRFFCPSEYAWIFQTEDLKEQKKRFYRLWTLKESFLKATGMGLLLPLNSFCFAFEGEHLSSFSQQYDDAEYLLEEYSFSDYSAAVCWRAAPCKIACGNGAACVIRNPPAGRFPL